MKRSARLILLLGIAFTLSGLFIRQRFQTPLSYSLNVPLVERIVTSPQTASPTLTPNSIPQLTQAAISKWVIELHESNRSDTSPAPTQNDSHHQVAQELAQIRTQQSELTNEVIRPILENDLSPRPAKSEVLQIFIPDNLRDWPSALSTQSTNLLQDEYEYFGVGIQAYTQDGQAGDLVILLTSTPHAIGTSTTGTASQQQAQQAEKISFTNQELWVALQKYRSDHSLPHFREKEELCEVARDRLKDQLELGKLDAHDGFDARADQFFEQQKDWRHLNENLASGYRTAVQTIEWGWDQSLGHQALMKSTEHPYACVATQDGFSVLITGS